MNPGALRQRFQIQRRVATQGAMGESVVWTFDREVSGRKIPLDTQTIARYDQLDTKVTHKILLRGEQDLPLGEYRILHRSSTHIIAEAAKHYDDYTEVVVEEV